MRETIKNRNQTFYDIQEHLPVKRKQVYVIIAANKFSTIETVARKLGKQKNEISGRFTELQDDFLIKAVGRKNGFTVFAPTTEDERIDLINKEFVRLRDQRDKIVDDLNTLDLTPYSKEILKKEVDKIEVSIKRLDNITYN